MILITQNSLWAEDEITDLGVLKFYPAHLLSLLPCKYIHKVIPKKLKKVKKTGFLQCWWEISDLLFYQTLPLFTIQIYLFTQKLIKIGLLGKLKSSLRLDYWVSLNLRFGISGFFSTFERPANFGRALKYVKIVNHNSLITPTFLDANSSKIT